MTDLREAAATRAQQELARRHLGDFLALMLTEYDRAAHVGVLLDHLEALEAREIDRLIVVEPPQHGKSCHVSQGLPAWWLGRHPRDNVILASYAAELAERNSRVARGFVSDERWPFHTRLSSESSAVGRWHTSDSGSVIAAGVRGAITGFGASLLVVDDPLKDREEADSAAILEANWQWWAQVAMTRIAPDAAVLLTQTRWSEGDLVGRVLNSKGADRWTVLRLPALSEGEGDPLGRPEGEPLWAKYGRQFLSEQRESMGPRAFAALYQGDPIPAKGAVFERAWFDGRWSKLPDELRIVQAVDSAFKDGVGNDFSVIATWASDGRSYFLLDVQRGKWQYPELVRQIVTAAEEWSPERVLVEDRASGQSVVQTLKAETGLPVVPVKAEGSKVSRAESVTGLFDAGKVLLPANDPAWLEPWVQEHVKFGSGGGHDDQVDTTAHALRHLRERARNGGGGVAGVLYYDAYGRLVSDSDDLGSIEEPLTPRDAYKRTGWRDPLSGGPGEFDDDDDLALIV
jgi:predicted phage terminase large subunit-like protein